MRHFEAVHDKSSRIEKDIITNAYVVSCSNLRAKNVFSVIVLLTGK